MAYTADLTGMRFGRLVVTGHHVDDERVEVGYWDCQCDCGRRCCTHGDGLVHSNCKSCGCLEYDINEARRQRPVKQRKGEWAAWFDVLERGHSIVEAWRTFEGFLGDMGYRPKGHRLKRKNRSQPYSKENCEWVPLRVKYTASDGTSLTISQWSKRVGVSSSVLWRRLNSGWSIDRAISTPSRKKRKHGRVAARKEPTEEEIAAQCAIFRARALAERQAGHYASSYQPGIRAYSTAVSQDGQTIFESM